MDNVQPEDRFWKEICVRARMRAVAAVRCESRSPDCALRRSTFDVRRSTFDVRRSAFGVLQKQRSGPTLNAHAAEPHSPHPRAFRRGGIPPAPEEIASRDECRRENQPEGKQECKRRPCHRYRHEHRVNESSAPRPQFRPAQSGSLVNLARELYQTAAHTAILVTCPQQFALQLGTRVHGGKPLCSPKSTPSPYPHSVNWPPSSAWHW